MEEAKTTLITFSTLEHTHYERSVDFYWTVGLIAAAVAALAFIFKDILFGVLILIGGGLYGYASWKRPQEVSVVITDKDISIGDDWYPIEKIESFRVADIAGDTRKEMILVIRRAYHPIVSVSIPEGLDMQVKEVLSRMLPVNETVVPHIGRRFMARFKI